MLTRARRLSVFFFARPLPDDGAPDVAGYNEELTARGSPTWHHVSWLFAECYLYRRIHASFALSKAWKDYDVFARSKTSTFRSSKRAVLELAAKYRQIQAQLRGGGPDVSNEERAAAEKLLFAEMCEICLWGNATDLSLLTSLTYEDIQKLQGSAAQKAREKNIIVNQLPDAYRVLHRARAERPKATRRVDIVLDNAGFELYVDLLLAGYLLAADLATEVVLHPKSIPWFVSDVLPKDFADLLSALAAPAKFYQAAEDAAADGRAPEALTEAEVEDLTALFEQWANLHREGQLVIRPNRFWTHAGSYWRMPSVAPKLFEDLKASELVIFKGDLNYRKLTGDVSGITTSNDLLG